MSTQVCHEPVCRSPGGAVATVIEPRARDLGGFSVRRVLPASQQPAVGPFIFFDEMGPAVFAPGAGIDVRPHPHIGLATLTWLFTGRILHRDSLGYVQPVEPGAVNWMTAGRGIVHSERTVPEDRAAGWRLHGIQSWIGLPDGQEEIEPTFEHYPAEAMPRCRLGNGEYQLIAGAAFGMTSPVAVYSPLFYAQADFAAAGAVELPQDCPERAVYVVAGSLQVDGQDFAAGRMVVLTGHARPALTAGPGTRLMLLGGEPLASPRRLWWNFVARTETRLEQARRDWREGRFPAVPDDPESIPLPQD